MVKIITILYFSIISISISFSQPPAGYYDSAEGLTGEDLRTALYNIIKNHDSQSYASLWTHFQTTDKIGSSQVYDMYSIRADGSSNYVFNYTGDQCGNYNAEGVCYNREHSFPKSWFGDTYPENTDLFHLYPTDGYTNGRRSAYPFGEVGSASWTSTNGSKLGSSDYPGYSGTVFEPIDEYKGDFARSYFYMLTRYKNDISSWDSDMLSGSNFSSWAEDMLLEWDAQDPVSQKETDRNNAVYGIQDNRNPFIDNPEWGVYVFAPETIGIDELKNDKFVVWYSNQSLFWKSIKEGQLEIYNIVGQKILSISINEGQMHKQLNLKKGVYIADFKSKNRTVLKFVVK